MRFTGDQFIEAIMRLQLLEGEFGLPTCRVGLTDGVGVERIAVDVGDVRPIPVALGEPDRDQTQAGANRTPGARVHATLERHLHSDIEEVLLKSAGQLLEPNALELDGAPAQLALGGDDARVCTGGQARDEPSSAFANAIKELAAKVDEVEHQQPSPDSCSHPHRAVVVPRGNFDLVCAVPAHSHHQAPLRRRREQILPRSGKETRKRPMQIHHRHVGGRYVSGSIARTVIAHLVRCELAHQLLEHRREHPCQFLNESVVEQLGNQQPPVTCSQPRRPRKHPFESGTESQHYSDCHLDLS